MSVEGGNLVDLPHANFVLEETRDLMSTLVVLLATIELGRSVCGVLYPRACAPGFTAREGRRERKTRRKAGAGGKALISKLGLINGRMDVGWAARRRLPSL